MEMKKLLESLEECGMAPMGGAPMDRGTPVSMNVSLNASGKEHVEDLINMMKNAGMGGAREVGADMMPMRMDMERLRDIVDGPKKLPAPDMDMEAEEGYDNEPDEQFGDLDAVTRSGDDLHKSKRAFAKAQDGDNAMAVEDEQTTLEQEILRALKADYAEKKTVKESIVEDGGEGPEDLLAAIDEEMKNPGKTIDNLQDVLNGTFDSMDSPEFERPRALIAKYLELVTNTDIDHYDDEDDPNHEDEPMIRRMRHGNLARHIREYDLGDYLAAAYHELDKVVRRS